MKALAEKVNAYYDNLLLQRKKINLPSTMHNIATSKTHTVVTKKVGRRRGKGDSTNWKLRKGKKLKENYVITQKQWKGKKWKMDKM